MDNYWCGCGVDTGDNFQKRRKRLGKQNNHRALHTCETKRLQKGAMKQGPRSKQTKKHLHYDYASGVANGVERKVDPSRDTGMLLSCHAVLLVSPLDVDGIAQAVWWRMEWTFYTEMLTRKTAWTNIQCGTTPACTVCV